VTAPDDEIGVAVPMRRVLAATPDVVIAVTECVAYSTGFQLGIGIRRKLDLEPRIFGMRGMQPRPPEPVEMTLELGVGFSDGRSSEHRGHRPSSVTMDYYRTIQEGGQPELPAGPVISGWNGGGGGKRWDMQYWIWPLPPDGPMTISCEWPAGGIPYASQEFDGRAIRMAGESNTRLWDGEP
jgi:hypothetical protein